jgi:hypothetical protein
MVNVPIRVEELSNHICDKNTEPDSNYSKQKTGAVYDENSENGKVCDLKQARIININ